MTTEQRLEEAEKDVERLTDALKRCERMLASHSSSCARDVAAATGDNPDELIATFQAENPVLQAARTALAAHLERIGQ